MYWHCLSRPWIFSAHVQKSHLQNVLTSTEEQKQASLRLLGVKYAHLLLEHCQVQESLKERRFFEVRRRGLLKCMKCFSLFVAFVVAILVYLWVSKVHLYCDKLLAAHWARYEICTSVLGYRAPLWILLLEIEVNRIFRSDSFKSSVIPKPRDTLDRMVNLSLIKSESDNVRESTQLGTRRFKFSEKKYVAYLEHCVVIFEPT
jgi:hypothetical protein